ncbi:MAG: DNA polymerase III subunit delta [bacterium]
MNYFDFIAHIQKKQFSPVYFLYGKEDYFIEDALNRLIDAACDSATKDFNLDVFYGNEVEGAKIFDAASSYPMLADTRVVVVKEVDKLSASGLELLNKYLDKPASSTILVIISGKSGLRNKAISNIKSKSLWVECRPLYDRQVPKWIQDHLKEKGLEISQEAVLLIHVRVGNNLRDIVNELEKIVLNLEGRKRIEPADVQNVVGLSRSYSVFDLTDAIGHKDLDKSLTILSRLLQSGESPTGILALITRHFVNLMKVKGAVAQKNSNDEITALTGIPPFFIAKTKEMANNFSADQLNLIFEYLLETDLILKTSRQPPKIAMETLLINIIKNRMKRW